MNRISILSTAVAAMFAFNASSQISLTYENHALKSGDDHNFVIANNVNPGDAGEDKYWDFSDLVKKSELTSHMLVASETPKAEQVPQSNTVIEEYSNKFHFKVSENIVEQYGVVSCNNSTVTTYDEPFVKMVFPMSYGDVYQGTFSGKVENNSRSSVITGEYDLEVDGYGTILLPGDIEIEDVIRLRTKRVRSSSCGSYSTITYRWYSEDVRYPLLSIITHERDGKTSVSRTAYYGNLDAALKEAEARKEAEKLSKLKSTVGGDVDVLIKPNPFTEEFDIIYNLAEESKVKIEIVNETSAKVYAEDLGIQDKGQQNYEISTAEAGMKPGVYMVNVIVNGFYNTTKVVQVSQ